MIKINDKTEFSYGSYLHLAKLIKQPHRSWLAKDTDLRIVRFEKQLNSFDELVEYLDNLGDERKLVLWAISLQEPTETMPRTWFKNKWLSFVIRGYTFYKQTRFKK